MRIAAERFISEAALAHALEALASAGILPPELAATPAQLLDERLGELHQDIKSMKLYNRPELLSALFRRLAHAGLSRGPCRFTDLLPYDQNHYFGTQALEAMQQTLRIGADSRVVNVGSGLGGPARFLAGTHGCQVLAIELQDDLHHAAVELTQRCGLAGKVHHVAGDFTQIAQHLNQGSYDFVVSWLTVLHFSDRAGMFRQAYELLRPGGMFFAADFVQQGKLTEAEWRTLRTEVACPSLAASPSVYCHELAAAGFKIVRCDDETAAWRAHTQARAEGLRQDTELQTVLGADVARGLQHFFDVVRDLYAGGNLGGLSVYAKRPLGW